MVGFRQNSLMSRIINALNYFFQYLLTITNVFYLFFWVYIEHINQFRIKRFHFTFFTSRSQYCNSNVFWSLTSKKIVWFNNFVVKLLYQSFQWLYSFTTGLSVSFKFRCFTSRTVVFYYNSSLIKLLYLIHLHLDTINSEY